MRPEFVEKAIAQRMRLSRIIWGSFLGSTVIFPLYAVIGKLSAAPASVPPSISPILPPLVLGLAVLSAVTAVFLRVKLLRPDRMIPPGQGTEPWIPEATLAMNRPETPAETRFLAALLKANKYLVICSALMESVAVLGLLLSLLSNDLTYAGFLWVGCFLGFFFLIPPGREFYQEIERMTPR